MFAFRKLLREGPIPRFLAGFTTPTRASKAEIEFRYLHFLDVEFLHLTRELGVRTADGMVTVYQDLMVNRFMQQPTKDGVMLPPTEHSRDRAERVLAAAGVSLCHDPDGFMFGERFEKFRTEG